jgi:hypothetical protein
VTCEQTLLQPAGMRMSLKPSLGALFSTAVDLKNWMQR